MVTLRYRVYDHILFANNCIFTSALGETRGVESRMDLAHLRTPCNSAKHFFLQHVWLTVFSLPDYYLSTHLFTKVFSSLLFDILVRPMFSGICATVHWTNLHHTLYVTVISLKERRRLKNFILTSQNVAILNFK